MLSYDEALELACRRDRWIWIKAPVAALLLIFLYAEQLWKAGTVLVGSVVCSFVTPCVPGAGAPSLWLAFLFRAGLIASVTAYVTYTIAWLVSPGWKNKVLSATAMLLFIPLFLMLVLAVALLAEKAGMPWDAIWAFESRWAPVASWRMSN